MAAMVYGINNNLPGNKFLALLSFSLCPLWFSLLQSFFVRFQCLIGIH